MDKVHGKVKRDGIQSSSREIHLRKTSRKIDEGWRWVNIIENNIHKGNRYECDDYMHYFNVQHIIFY